MGKDSSSVLEELGWEADRPGIVKEKTVLSAQKAYGVPEINFEKECRRGVTVLLLCVEKILQLHPHFE